MNLTPGFKELKSKAIKTSKNYLRSIMKSRRDEYFDHAMRMTFQSQEIYKTAYYEYITSILDEKSYQQSSNTMIAGFYSINSEIECQKILSILNRVDGYKTALPRVHEGKMYFHEWSPGDELVTGKYGVQEPLESAPIGIPDVVLTPLLAFDTKM